MDAAIVGGASRKAGNTLSKKTPGTGVHQRLPNWVPEPSGFSTVQLLTGVKVAPLQVVEPAFSDSSEGKERNG